MKSKLGTPGMKRSMPLLDLASHHGQRMPRLTVRGSQARPEVPLRHSDHPLLSIPSGLHNTALTLMDIVGLRSSYLLLDGDGMRRLPRPKVTGLPCRLRLRLPEWFTMATS